MQPKAFIDTIVLLKQGKKRTIMVMVNPKANLHNI